MQHVMNGDPLKHRWLWLADSNGIANAANIWNRLNAGYTDGGRHYHNWAHIDDCLAKFDRLRELANDHLAVELAIWFHDAIYDSRRSDNEEQSAVLAESCLRSLQSSDRVMEMIRGSSHALPPKDHDGALLCDIDLSILGAESARYDHYAKTIRKEYDWVNAVDYRAGRSKVLNSFLARSVIYSNPECSELWEAEARTNIKRELDSLL